MRTLEFTGKVRSNKGRFHEDMVVPGRVALSSAPDDWPTELASGTLNVQINDEGFPDDFGEIGDGRGVKKFDEGRFPPAFVIPQSEIIGNTLKPKEGKPHRGTGQVWRAELRNLTTGESAKCWMLRRINSGIAAQIELVSEYRLRDRLRLSDETPVRVTVFEG